MLGLLQGGLPKRNQNQIAGIVPFADKAAGSHGSLQQIDAGTISRPGGGGLGQRVPYSRRNVRRVRYDFGHFSELL